MNISQEIDKYREMAFEKIDSDEDHELTEEERNRLIFAYTLDFPVPQSAEAQIERDLENKNGLYDMLAMWLDRERDIASICPEQELEIAKIFLTQPQ